jgi:hypothetical protein
MNVARRMQRVAEEFYSFLVCRGKEKRKREKKKILMKNCSFDD